MSNDKERKLWVAFTNTDLTEGRGRQIPLAVCDMETTAKRLGKGKYVMGSDCPVSFVPLRNIDGAWYAPIHIVGIHSASKDDIAEQERIDRKAAAIDKAKAAGLTDSDIKALSLH